MATLSRFGGLYMQNICCFVYTLQSVSHTLITIRSLTNDKEAEVRVHDVFGASFAIFMNVTGSKHILNAKT